MSIITATYATIARELWGQQAIGAVPTAVQIETIKSKRRVSQNKHFHFIENTKCAIELFCKCVSGSFLRQVFVQENCLDHSFPSGASVSTATASSTLNIYD